MQFVGPEAEALIHLENRRRARRAACQCVPVRHLLRGLRWAAAAHTNAPIRKDRGVVLHRDVAEDQPKIFIVTSAPWFIGLASLMSVIASQLAATSSTVALSPSFAPLPSTIWTLA